MSQPPDLLSPEAWPRLIEALDPPRLLAVIDYRMSTALQSRCSAEDIYQEALLQAWLSREQFEWRGPKSFRSWVLKIVDHRIRDETDRHATQKRDTSREVHVLSATIAGASTSASGMSFPAGSTTPSQIASYREEADLRRAALDSLPDEVREVVRLRYFEDLELEEIARRLDLGVSAVRHRSRKGELLFAQRLRVQRDSRSAPQIRDSSAPRRPSPSE